MFREPREPNTFIGGVGAAYITSATALASKLSIVSGYIHNFKIDSNNNISCYIGRNYNILSRAFYRRSEFSYYIDIDGKCQYIGNESFHNPFGPAISKILIFPNLTSCGTRVISGGGAGTRNTNGIICFPELEPVGTSGTVNDNCFSWADWSRYVYVDIGNQTNNSGGVEADISSAISSSIATWIKYSSNNNKPPIVTGVTTTDIGIDYINLSWTAVSHSNTIDYYIVIMNGIARVATTNSLNVTGLTSGTDYETKILAVDSMGNTNKFSEIVTFTTL
jgi:hypothetical protein